MADDNNSETETNKESGYWKEVENKEVIKRIAEIDKELDNYSTLKSKVDALATALEQCNLHLSKVYEAATSAIKINNAAFNTNMEGIQTLSKDISNSISELRTIIGQISKEVTKLTDEKKDKESKKYTKEWVKTS